MSKVNAIRKKALEHVRKQDWQSAVKEYKRLAELDQSNPNVFNELGDIYLKTGNKAEAYEAFGRAIDSYTRVSLHNNAVAVCKKVLRLIPARIDVLIKLGLIRKKQGLIKEAESYYFSYLDKVLVDQQANPADVKKSCDDIIEEMSRSAPVMERVYECLVKFNLKEETGELLQHLYKAYHVEGDQEQLDRTRERLAEVGVDPPSVPVIPATPEKEGAIITEENIWSAAHTDGERIAVHRSEKQAKPLTPAGPGGGSPDSVYEYGEVEIGTNQATQATGDTGGTTPAAAGPDQSEAPGEADGQTAAGLHAPGAATQTAPEPPQPEQTAAGEPAPAPAYDVTPEEESEAEAVAPPVGGGDTAPPDSPGSRRDATDIHVSAIMDGLDGGGEASEDDYRSHYDLGMAYLEMDLFAEAIREYQFASKSPDFQAKALEMIGLCFLKQNQAHLAIKQLTKGLQVIGEGDVEALGIKYNLGLAYEMAGDFEKAKSEFEDVYVEDVTFRDVAKKIEKYS